MRTRTPERRHWGWVNSAGVKVAGDGGWQSSLAGGLTTITFDVPFVLEMPAIHISAIAHGFVLAPFDAVTLPFYTFRVYYSSAQNGAAGGQTFFFSAVGRWNP